MNGKNPELTVEAKVATKKNAGKGRTPKSPVWKVLDDARKKFNAQIVKSTSVKRECIKACIGKYYADDLRFWLDLLSQSEKLLLDSMRFNKACDNLGLAPKTVAQHILFESEKTAKRILIEGVEAVLGERVRCSPNRFTWMRRNSMPTAVPMCRRRRAKHLLRLVRR